MISVAVNSNAAAVAASVAQFPREMLGALATELDHQNELTVGHIVRKYLSYPRKGPSQPFGLRVQTNRLRSNLGRTDAVIDGQSVKAALTNNVFYAAVHEFGYTGNVPVRAFTRAEPRRDVFTATKSGKKKQLASGIARVKAHSRKMNLPARAPVHRGLADRLATYKTKLTAAAVAAWKGGPV